MRLTLGQIVSGLPADREIMAGLPVSRLRESCSRLPDEANPGGVALYIRDLRFALHAAVALDGRASAIVLASPQADGKEVSAIAKRAGCRFILSDQAERFPAEATPQVISDLSDLKQIQRAEREGTAETQWMLSTSGTTGTAKLVAHCLASLTRTCKTDPIRGEGVRWGLLYDYTRYAGLQVVLQSLLGGSYLIAPPLESPLDERIDVLVREACTHLSATPTLWRQILMCPGSEHLPLRQITLGGEIADQPLLNQLAARYAEARISHIFASTEAGVGFSVSDRRAGFPAAYLSEPPQGIALKIADGRLLIRNTDVAGQYVGREESFRDEEGFVDTGDRVEIRGDRVFFLGRDSGVINVGGEKVHPEYVESRLREHPDVAAVRVFGQANPITGALVMAEVVTHTEHPDHKAWQAELRAWCRERLTRTETPAMFRRVDHLAVTGAGKLARSDGVFK